MTTKRFVISAVIALAMLAGYNVLISAASKKTQRQHLLAVIRQMPAGTECLFLGNSLMEAGGDTGAFKSAWPAGPAPGTVNLALGATTPVEHYLILKQALDRPQRVKFIVYGFFDDQLCAPVRGDWEDLIGNRAFSYYYPGEAARFYAPGSRWEEWRMEIIGHVPMLADRSSIWDKVELLRMRLDQVGMPEQKMNRFGRVSNFAALEATDVPSFVTRCNAVMGGGQFSPPVEGILQLAARHSAKVFLVEMPMSPGHRKTFYSLPVWAQLRTHLQALATSQNAVYIRADDWVRDRSNFDDAVHLNEEGAKYFSRRLAETLASMVSDISNSVAATGQTIGPIARRN